MLKLWFTAFSQTLKFYITASAVFFFFLILGCFNFLIQG